MSYSRVQPGRLVSDNELLPELTGSLTPIQPTEHSGQYVKCFIGVWERPDVSTRTVFMKRVLIWYTIDENKFNAIVKKEVVIWRAINHPNILPFVGSKLIKGNTWLVSPWCQHGNLQRYISDNPGLTHVEQLKLACDVARGLAHLHSRTPPIVHGDLKPENVLIQDNLEAALCDFRTSRVLSLGGANDCVTIDEWQPLRTAYQAKEVLAGDRLTAPGDVYALGGLILLAISGKPPFWGKTEVAKVMAIGFDQTPNPNDHPCLPEADPLWSLLRECWNGDLQNRPTSDTVLQKLERTMKVRSTHSTYLTDL